MKLTTDQYDPIRKEWQAKHKVSKFLGNYSSKQFYSHWKAVTRTNFTKSCNLVNTSHKNRANQKFREPSDSENFPLSFSYKRKK